MSSIIRFMVISCVACCFLLAGCSSEQGKQKEAHVGILDANTYRAEILAVEAVLYKASPASLDDFTRMAAAMTDLYESIQARETHLIKKDAANRILFLTARADAGSDVGYALPNFADIRADWESTRFDVFGEADWFHRAGDALVVAQTPKVPKPDAGEVYELVRVIERLEDILAEGQDECDDLGEPEYDPERMDSRGHSQVAGWDQFYRDWDEQLNQIADRLPPQPSWSGDQDHVTAYQEVNQAFGELRLVAVGAGMWPTPFRYQWEQRFDAAEAHLAEARKRLGEQE